MVFLKSATAAAVAVAALLIGGNASAALPPINSLDVGPGPSETRLYVADTPAPPIVLAAAEEPTKGHHYDPEEFERQSAVLAPKEGDNTRLYVFGGLGIVLAVLLTLVACNRKKWQGPSV